MLSLRTRTHHPLRDKWHQPSSSHCEKLLVIPVETRSNKTRSSNKSHRTTDGPPPAQERSPARPSPARHSQDELPSPPNSSSPRTRFTPATRTKARGLPLHIQKSLLQDIEDAGGLGLAIYGPTSSCSAKAFHLRNICIGAATSLAKSGQSDADKFKTSILGGSYWNRPTTIYFWPTWVSNQDKGEHFLQSSSPPHRHILISSSWCQAAPLLLVQRAADPHHTKINASCCQQEQYHHHNLLPLWSCKSRHLVRQGQHCCCQKQQQAAGAWRRESSSLCWRTTITVREWWCMPVALFIPLFFSRRVSSCEFPRYHQCKRHPP